MKSDRFTTTSRGLNVKEAPGNQHRFSGRTLVRRIDKSIQASRLPALGLLCLGLVIVHYFFLGFTSWDGITYRVPPIVELLQHGDLGGNKFNYPAAQNLYPFLELLHLPFLKLLGLPGLYFSFPLLLFPASVLAIYGFTKELTESSRWATYSALVFVAIPFVNSQPFSAYIDFGVIGAFAFYLYSLLRVLKSNQYTVRNLALLSLATFLFTMSRQQAPYVALLTGLFFTYWFRPNHEFPTSAEEARHYRPRRIWPVLTAFFLGLLPAATLHTLRYLRYGSPIYPYQFKLLAFSTKVGLSPEYTMAGAGLIEPGWPGMLDGFVRGWLWSTVLPRDFYDSRQLGVGLLLWVLLLELPLVVRMIRADHLKVIALFVVIALLGQDFWLPRWSMTLILVLVLCVGAAISWAASRGSWALYLGLLVVVGIHIARPAYDVYALSLGDEPAFRVNISGSEAFVGGPGELKLYPDLNADFLIVHPVINEFTLLLYGRQMTNRIVGVIDPEVVGNTCVYRASSPENRQLLIVDQTGKLQDISSSCEWVCRYQGAAFCLAGDLAKSD